MKVELWTLLLAALGGGGLVRLLSVRAQNRRTYAEADQLEANSAVALAKAYSALIEDLRKGLSRQDEELKTLRAMVVARDEEIAAVRSENGGLRERVAGLEAQVQALGSMS